MLRDDSCIAVRSLFGDRRPAGDRFLYAEKGLHIFSRYIYFYPIDVRGEYRVLVRTIILYTGIRCFNQQIYKVNFCGYPFNLVTVIITYCVY